MSADRESISAAAACGPLFLGLDGRNRLAGVCLVDDRGRSLADFTVDASDGRLEPSLLDVAAEAARRAGVDRSAIVRAGMAVADGLTGRPQADGSSDLPLSLIPAANAAAYGEFWLGAGQDYHSVLLVELGETIECGLVVSELLAKGEYIPVGLSGHMIIDPDDTARQCRCGLRGHLDAYASTQALVSRAEERLASGVSTSLSQRKNAIGSLSAQLVAEEAALGDAEAIELVMQTAQYLGVGVVNLMHTVDPTVVLLAGPGTFGGEASAVGRQFLARLKEEVNRRAFPWLAARTRIGFAALGDAATCLGAAGIARADYRRATG